MAVGEPYDGKGFADVLATKLVLVSKTFVDKITFD
jgi:hypothetical protein